MNPQNLHQYYTSQGQNLPSVQERSPLYSQYGGQGNYTGTEQQNQFLLGRLLGGGNTPPPTRNPGIVSTTPIHAEFQQNSNTLDNFANDPYMKLFQKFSERNQHQYDLERMNAEAEANRQKVATGEQFSRYKAGVETADLAGGLSRYAPGLHAGNLAQVDVLQNQAVAKIQASEDLAIARAQQAKEDGDAVVLKEQIDYIQQLRKAKADAIQQANDDAFAREKFDEDKRQFNVTNARLSGGDSGGGKALSTLELGRIEDLYGVALPFGTTEEEAMKLLSDEGAIDASATDASATDATIEDAPKNVLFNLAKALGLRRVSLGKKDEIKRLEEKFPTIKKDVQKLLNEGYTEKEIAAYYLSL